MTNTEKKSSAADASPAALAATRGDLTVAPVFTLVLWLTCLTVGAVGFVLPYARPKVICFCEEPVEAQKLEVELTAEEIKPAELPAPDPSLPPTAEALTLPPMPQPSAPVVAVATASPTVAFTVPILNPTRIALPAKSASYIVPAATPAPTAISFGRGEGKQPAPKYPRQAVREGQEGIVGVVFSVGVDGRVVAAELKSPSPWELLNREALRVIREEWRFVSGPVRFHEISIVFQLTK
ncbi:MAG: TonB family protein [Verrucomicrobia bacterium]|nr:TonB family protein [Verrucomicrobiota bacterium]